MFKSNKNTKPTKRTKGGGGGSALMQQMGFQIPDFDDPNFGANDDDEDDESLEAELQLYQQGGGAATKRTKANQKKSGAPTQDLQSFQSDVNKLLSDIDRPMNDDELSDVDENELLAELHEITGEVEEEQQEKPVQTKPVQSASNNGIVSLLETRLDMYKKGVETAKANGESTKARRYERQLNQIKELLQSARTGAPINESEIPPAIGGGGGTTVAPVVQSEPTIVPEQMPVRAPSPPRAQPPPKVSLPVNDKPIVSELQTSVSVSNTNSSDEAIARLKQLALQAKSAGDMTKAKEYLIQMKQLQSGATPISASAPLPPPASIQTETHENVPDDDSSAAVPIPLTAPEPRTVMEALQQRHEELTKRHQEAVTKGESSKARRMDRLKKQYEEAIEATRKGRPYDYSELADLPGFAPIPYQQSKAQPTTSTTNVAAPPVKPPQATAQVRPVPTQLQSMPSTGSISQSGTKTSMNAQNDQQVQTLRLKQEQYRKLALQAKEKGDSDTAKKYLLEYKKLEQMIASTASASSASSIDTIPTSESPTEDYDVVRDDELTQELSQSSREIIYQRLQEDLLRQIQLCARNQQMYAQMEGTNNVKNAQQYGLLGQRCQRDLDRLKQSFQQGLKAPVFHYERRQMNIIQVNNDLTDNDLEVTVVRGINLPVPAGYSSTNLETYVIIELPYPSDTCQTARTRHAMGSTNAEYADPLHKFQIKRNDTKLRRLMSRKELKLTIFYKAGFLRSDRQLGIAFVKLAGLEQTATIHESVDVYENDHKKKAAGKLEVKIRIKEALGQMKAAELLPQRWLVIDRFEDTPANSKSSTTKSQSSTLSSITAISRLVPTTETLGLLAIKLAENINQNNDEIIDSSRSNVVESNNDSRRNSQQQQQVGPQSIQVLKYESELLQEQIEKLEDHFTPEQIEQLRLKQKSLKEQNERIVANLRQGGKQAVEEHVKGLEQLVERYTREEDEYRQRNDTKKADLISNKKKLVMEEIETLTK